VLLAFDQRLAIRDVMIQHTLALAADGVHANVSRFVSGIAECCAVLQRDRRVVVFDARIRRLVAYIMCHIFMQCQSSNEGQQHEDRSHC
jgi:hypothetical protein